MTDRDARRQRLSRSADFERVYRHGVSSQHRLLVLYRFRRADDLEPDDAGRVGITVSRKVGSAVVRNRIKRQLREAIDRAAVVTEGTDLVAIARPGLDAAIEKQGFEWLVELVGEVASGLREVPAK